MLLALNGRMTRSIMTKWLLEKGVQTHEASEWNELTLNLHDFFTTQKPQSETQESNLGSSIFVIIIDVGLLDLSTELWKQQLNFLEEYCADRASFAWILNHDTSKVVKAELRKRGHLLMVNKPLYKAKLVQIFEAVIKRDRNLHLQTQVAEHEFHEIDSLQSPSASSDESEKLENDSCNAIRGSEYFSRGPLSQSTLSSSCADYIHVNLEDDVSILSKEQSSTKSYHEDKEGGAASSCKAVNEQKRPLEGLCILLAEDTIVLQRVATIMLEKMGARIVVVGDGIQAVDALKNKSQSNEHSDAKALPYDLILMDCQVS